MREFSLKEEERRNGLRSPLPSNSLATRRGEGEGEEEREEKEAREEREEREEKEPQL